MRPSRESTINSSGMCAGTVTVGRLSLPLARIVKRAGSRTFVPAVAALYVDGRLPPHPAKRTVTTAPARTTRRLTFAG